MSKGRQDDEGMTIAKQDQITNYYKYSYLYEYQIRLNTVKSPQYLHFFLPSDFHRCQVRQVSKLPNCFPGFQGIISTDVVEIITNRGSTKSVSAEVLEDSEVPTSSQAINPGKASIPMLQESFWDAQLKHGKHLRIFFHNKMETSNLLTCCFLAGFVLISWISSPVKTCKFRGCYLCVGLGWPWYDNHFPCDGWNLGEHLLPIRFLLDCVLSISDSRCEVWCCMAGVLAAEIHRMTELQVFVFFHDRKWM